MLQSLPCRQKITQSSKYKINRRQTPDFIGTFPEECIAPQNTPRGSGHERPESWPWKKLPILRFSKSLCHTRPASQNEVIGGCGRLSVSPNMDLGKKINVEQQLPPIATVRDWREISPELLKKDVAWNVLCKHCPQIGSHSRQDYFQRVIKWRKGIVDGNEKRKCLICDIQRVTTKPMHSNQMAQKDYDRVISRLSYSHDYYDKFSSRKRKQRPSVSSSFQLTKKKNLQNRIKRSNLTPPPPPGSALAENPSSGVIASVETPDTALEEGKISRYLQLYVPHKKEIHPKCRPLGKIFEPAYQILSGPLQTVYKRKSLPGILQKKTKIERPVFKSNKMSNFEGEVGNLGLLYSLPDYNHNIGKRHVSIPKNSTHSSIFENHQKKISQINRTPSTPVFPITPRFIKPYKSTFN